jgi:hypothetical protein
MDLAGPNYFLTIAFLLKKKTQNQNGQPMPQGKSDIKGLE